jgi:hypothetical protein
VCRGGGGEIGFEAGEALGGEGGGGAYRLQLEERAGRRGGGGEIGFEAGEAGRGEGGGRALPYWPFSDFFKQPDDAHCIPAIARQVCIASAC